MRRNDKGDGPIPDPIAILDAVIDHVAEEEAETGEPTEQDLRWSHDLRREMQSRIAALRGQLTSAQPIAQPVSPVSTEVVRSTARACLRGSRPCAWATTTRRI